MSKEELGLRTKVEQLEQQNEELVRRLGQLEKKISTNEQCGRTMVKCLVTQRPVVEAVQDVFRKSLREDAETREELNAAMNDFDKHKFRRTVSEVIGIIMWALSVGQEDTLPWTLRKSRLCFRISI